MAMEPGARYVMYLGRRHKVIGFHKPKKMWALEHPKDPRQIVWAKHSDVIHIKGKPNVDPNQGELFKRDSTYAHRKHLAAGLAYTGAGIGVTALGTRGGASAVRHLKPLARWKKHASALENASTTLTTVGAGSGAVGSINFARIQNQEAKQNIKKMGERMAARYTVAMLEASQRAGKGGKRVKLRKLSASALESLARDASPLAQGATHLVHKRSSSYNERLGGIKRQAANSDESVAHEQKRVKATPNTYSVVPKKMFDSERSRKRRSYAYEGAAAGGSAGAAFGALRPSPPDVKAGRAKVSEHVSGFKQHMDESARLFMEMDNPANAKAKGSNARQAYANQRKAQFHLGEAGKGYKANAPKLKVLRASRAKFGAAAVGLAAGAAVVHHNRNNQGRAYTSWHDGSNGPKKVKLKSKNLS